LEIHCVWLEQHTAACYPQSPAHPLDATKEIRAYIQQHFLGLNGAVGTAIEDASAMFALDRHSEDVLSTEWARLLVLLCCSSKDLFLLARFAQ